MNRTTICIASSRSYARLLKAVLEMNENLYKEDIFAEDRIEFNDVYDAEGNLTHFEITGTALDMFQIGLKYGRSEENESMQPYLMDIYKKSVYKPLETSAL